MEGGDGTLHPWGCGCCPSQASWSGVRLDTALRFLSDWFLWLLAYWSGLWLLFSGNSASGAQTPCSALLYETVSSWEQTVVHLSAVTPMAFVGPVPGVCVS